ncbi:MAG: flavin reductase family protein [Bryobacteraceae bacterium]
MIRVIDLSRSGKLTAAIIDPDTFRKTCSRFATGIAIATVTDADGAPFGLTINSFTSVSCSPPLVLICVDFRCNILSHFRSAPYYGINVLSEAQRELSVRFSQPQGDRFADIGWSQGITGVPLLQGSLACMECCVTQTVDAGDHVVLLAEVIYARYAEGDPLLYYRSRYGALSSK